MGPNLSKGAPRTEPQEAPNVLLIRGERTLLAHCHTCLGTGGYSVSTGQVERTLSCTHESVESYALASLHRMRESQGDSGDAKLLSGD